MEKEGIKNSYLRVAILAAGGLFGGLANGLLGAGGGIIMTFVLEAAMSESEMPRRDIFANVIAATLPISLLSAIIYGLKGNIQTERFGDFVIPAAAGGLIGAYLLQRINTVLLKRIFSLLVIWSGIYMIMK
ncbi:MAG: sulfite exporter TauE/SafE family protein [Clostridia bacterium]|nr:sulfite exporter TauE/SafE family protein [Clostridia bacterium]